MSQAELRNALTLLVELGELELNCPACPDPPEGFHYDLRKATKVTRQFLREIRPPAGRYFTSPDQRRGAGRERKLIKLLSTGDR